MRCNVAANVRHISNGFNERISAWDTMPRGREIDSGLFPLSSRFSQHAVDTRITGRKSLSRATYKLGSSPATGSTKLSIDRPLNFCRLPLSHEVYYKKFFIGGMYVKIYGAIIHLFYIPHFYIPN